MTTVEEHCADFRSFTIVITTALKARRFLPSRIYHGADVDYRTAASGPFSVSPVNGARSVSRAVCRSFGDRTTKLMLTGPSQPRPARDSAAPSEPSLGRQTRNVRYSPIMATFFFASAVSLPSSCGFFDADVLFYRTTGDGADDAPVDRTGHLFRKVPNSQHFDRSTRPASSKVSRCLPVFFC